MTGVFPDKEEKNILTKGPLKLVKCDDKDGYSCGLLQLENSYDVHKLFGDNYGYRSGLNLSMSLHLKNKVKNILKIVNLSKNDLIIDIGSNDGTMLSAYPKHHILVGIDPAASKFKKFYKENINLIIDFFSSDLIKKYYPNKKAKIITSFSMFYDLEAPLDFAKQIYQIIDPKEGIWALEQSYMPTMLKSVAYDTICHEHREYYSMQQILWITKKIGFKVIDIELNEINGGSFSLILSHQKSVYKSCDSLIKKFIESEKKQNLSSTDTYKLFETNINNSKNELENLVLNQTKKGKIFFGLGASTKGNVLLQYCGFGPQHIKAIGDINIDKEGKFTPGTWIPIISEEKVLEENPDFLLVLPWHFKEYFKKNNKFKNQNLVFPLPSLEIFKVS